MGDPNHFATNAKILHIDIDPAEINKNIQTDASIIGDVKIILRKLNARLDPMNHDEWLSHIERLKDMYPLRYNKDSSDRSVYHGRDLQGNRRRCDHLYRCRTASDVGGTVL